MLKIVDFLSKFRMVVTAPKKLILVWMFGLLCSAAIGFLLYAHHALPQAAVEALVAVLVLALCSLLFVGWNVARYEDLKRAFQGTRELFALFSTGVKDCSIILLDGKGRIRNWNAGAAQLQGFPARDMLGKHYSRLFAGEEVQADKPAQALEKAEAEGRFEDVGWRVRKQGPPFLAQCVITPLRDRKDGLRGYAVLTRDITEARRSEKMLQKLSTSVEQAADLVVITDRECTVEYVNKAAEDITGYTLDEFVKRGLKLLRSDGPDEYLSRMMRDTALSGRPFESTLVTSKKGGELLYLDAVATPIKDASGTVTHVVFTGTDVTHVKNLKDRLEYLASYDVVTGLPNRTLFADRLARSCTQAGNRTFAVLAIDIDRFKFINEICGFDAGNNALKQVAESLSVSVSKGDTVGRLGSDEFGVILHDVARPADAVLFAKMILKNVPQTVMDGGEQIAMTLGIGIALYPNDGQDALALMKNADTALSRAKSLGRNNYQFYAADMHIGVSELIIMERRLADALKNKEYVLSYQPYCHLSTKCVAGMEALIKWKNEEFGLVSPAKFIPLLEETGMIIDVGKWVLRTACKQLAEWNNGKSRFPVSVNLSLSQFRHEYLVETVERTVKDYRIDPKRLTLEITESIFMKDLDFAIAVLKRLKNIGVLISIDDFGTGYSSLSYLKRFPVDSIKIDQSFVKDVTTDPDTTSLVVAIISMAHSLNLKTIAEGVETEEQWKILRLLKCDMGQGFYFSPAMAPKDCEKFLDGADRT